MHQVRQASMVYFRHGGNSQGKDYLRNLAVKQAVIRPLSANIPFDRDGDAILFTLDRPRKLSIEINGERFSNLHLFANPLEENAPQPDDPNVLLLNPAIHRTEDIYRLAATPSFAGRQSPRMSFTLHRVCTTWKRPYCAYLPVLGSILLAEPSLSAHSFVRCRKCCHSG